MVKQYPYFLEIQKKGEAGYDEYAGMFYFGLPDYWKRLCPCRDESSVGRRAVTTDGEVYVFSSVIFLPKLNIDLISGTRVRVVDEVGNIRIEGDVLNFVKNQLNAKIWI